MKTEHTDIIKQKNITKWTDWVVQKYDFNREDADDIVQEAIYQTLIRFNPLPEEDKIKFNLLGYIFRAIQGQAIKKKQNNKIKDKHFQQTPELFNENGEEVNYLEEMIVDDKDEFAEDKKNAKQDIVYTILNLVANNRTELHFQLFFNYYFEKQKINDIAKNSGITYKFIKSSINTTNQMIKDKLKIKNITAIAKKYELDKPY